MARPSSKRKQSDDPTPDDDDLRPCPLPGRHGFDVCDMCCGVSWDRNKFLWIVKIPWVARTWVEWGESPWVARWRPGGFGWRLVDRADLSPDFVARSTESSKYVCFLCAGVFVHGDRGHFMFNRFTGSRRPVHRSLPCCVDPDADWKKHDQQSVLHSAPNLRKNTESNNPPCLCPECVIVTCVTEWTHRLGHDAMSP